MFGFYGMTHYFNFLTPLTVSNKFENNVCDQKTIFSTKILLITFSNTIFLSLWTNGIDVISLQHMIQW